MISLQFPSTLEMDFSGVIKQVGEGVSSSDFNKEMRTMAGMIRGGISVACV